MLARMNVPAVVALMLVLTGCAEAQPPAVPSTSAVPTTAAAPAADPSPVKLAEQRVADVVVDWLTMTQSQIDVARWQERHRDEADRFLRRFHELLDESAPSANGNADHAALLKKLLALHHPETLKDWTDERLEQLAANLFAACRNPRQELLSSPDYIGYRTFFRCDRGAKDAPPTADKGKACADYAAEYVAQVFDPEAKAAAAANAGPPKEIEALVQEAFGVSLQELTRSGDPKEEQALTDHYRRAVAKHRPEKVELFNSVIGLARMTHTKNSQVAVRNYLAAVYRDEIRFRALDLDDNGILDFWTGEIEEMYRAAEAATASRPYSDDVGLGVFGDSLTHGIVPTILGSPRVVKTVAFDEAGRPYAEDTDGSGRKCRHRSRFAVCIAPKQYGFGLVGSQTYLIDESGVIWYTDAEGRSVERLPKDFEAEGWTRSSTQPFEQQIATFEAALKAFQSGDSAVRLKAVDSLGNRVPWAMQAIPALLAAAKDADVELRAAVLRALGRIGSQSPEILPALKRGLDDPDPRVREACAAGAATFGREGAELLAERFQRDAASRKSIAEALRAAPMSWKWSLPVFLELAKSNQADDRRVAFAVFADMGQAAASAVPQLAAALKDPDPAVQRNALKALGQIATEAAVTPLLEYVVVAPDATRSEAAETLVRVGKPAVPRLIKALAEEDLMFGYVAAKVLGKIGPSAVAATPALLQGLKRNNPTFRQAAAQAVVNIGPEGLPHFFAALQDRDVEHRRDVADLLYQMQAKPRSAAVGLRKALDDGDEYVRIVCAADYVACEGDYQVAWPILFPALKSDDAGLAQTAAQALIIIGPETAPPLIAALKDPSARLRSAAAMVLSKIQPPPLEAATAVIAALNDEKDLVRAAAVNAAAALAPYAPEVVGPLAARLADDGKDVRLLTARALGIVGPAAASAVPTIIKTLQALPADASGDEARIELIDALGKIGPAAKAALPPLLKAAEDSTNAGVRTVAVGALHRITVDAQEAESSPVVERLVAALSDPDRTVRLAAFMAFTERNRMTAAAVPALTAALTDVDVNIRLLAATALLSARPSDEGALRTFTELLDHSDSQVVRSALSMLELPGVSAKNLAPQVAKLGGDGRTDVARVLWKLTGESRSAIPVFLSKIRGDDDSAGLQASEDLAAIGRDALPEINPALSDAEPRVRYRALYALFKMGSAARDAQQRILPLLADENASVRCGAALALLNISESPPAEAVTGAIRALQDEDKGIRQLAAAGIGELAKPITQLTAELHPSLKDKNPQVRVAAFQSLRKIEAAHGKNN